MNMNVLYWFKRKPDGQVDLTEIIQATAICLIDLVEPTLEGTGSKEISWEKGNMEVIVRNRRRKPYAKPHDIIAPGDPRFIGPLTPEQEALLQANLDKAEKQEP